MFKTLRTMIVALAVAASGALPAMATEEPVFTLVRKEGSFEIRDYAPVIVAETTLTGSAERARNAGFQPLADYIFAKDRKGSTIAMTAPVTQAPREQIAMTAPLVDGQVKYTDGTAATVANYAKDTAAFLSWAADPKLEERKRLGMLVMLYLLITTILLYFAKRRTWAKVPH